MDKKTLREKKNSDIRNRVKIGNNSSADIFVSIHLNKIPENQYYGWQTFFKDGNEDGKRLATCIQNNLNETMQKENKRTPLKINNVYIIKHVDCLLYTSKELDSRFVIFTILTMVDYAQLNLQKDQTLDLSLHFHHLL